MKIDVQLVIVSINWKNGEFFVVSQPNIYGHDEKKWYIPTKECHPAAQTEDTARQFFGEIVNLSQNWVALHLHSTDKKSPDHLVVTYHCSVPLGTTLKSGELMNVGGIPLGVCGYTALTDAVRSIA